MSTTDTKLTSADKMLALFSALRADEHELTMRQIAVLALAAKLPGRSVREMADDMAVSKPAVTRALDRLALRGLLIRQTSPQDRRLVMVNATYAGNKLLERIAKAAA